MTDARFQAGGFNDTGKSRLMYFPTVDTARAEPRLYALTSSVYIQGIGVFFADLTDNTTPDDGVHGFKVTAVANGRFVAAPLSGSTSILKLYATCALARADFANALNYGAIGIVNRGLFYKVTSTTRTDSLNELTDFIGPSAPGFQLEERSYNDYIDLVTEPAYKPARVYYQDGTLNVMGQYKGTALGIGKEQWIDVVNDTNALMPNATAFYLKGPVGQRQGIDLAVNGNGFGARTVGLTTHAIAAHQNGVGCVFGLVHDVNTNAYTAGNMLYTSTVGGGLTTTIPPGNVDGAFICYVMNSHPTDGTLFVSPFALRKQTYTTGTRPTTNRRSGDMVLDSTLNVPIWWNGTVWINASGVTV